MEITGKVHCFFEQSGTFKNEFIKLGYQAEDYDIQNNFGQTDNVIDLFSEIDTDFEQNRTEQACHNIRFYVKQRFNSCVLSLHLFLCYITNGILYGVSKLSLSY